VNAAVQSAANLDLGTAAEQIGPAVESLVSSSQAFLGSATTACG
jgi:hypothetical protein